MIQDDDGNLYTIKGVALTIDLPFFVGDDGKQVIQVGIMMAPTNPHANYKGIKTALTPEMAEEVANQILSAAKSCREAQAIADMGATPLVDGTLMA